MGVNRAHDGVRSDRCVFRLLDDIAEGIAQLGGAALEKAEGASVAINGARSDCVIRGDVFRSVPVDEFLFDGLAFRVVADRAVPRVVRERGLRL